MRLVTHLSAALVVSALHLRATTTQVVDVDAKPPLPPGIQVVILLAMQYFVVYSALQIAQTQSQMKTPGMKGMWQKIFEDAACTVDFCPMLGVLFLAMRMRAQQLWPPNGKVPEWGQMWMYACAAGVFMGTMAAILSGWLAGGKQPEAKKKYQGIELGGVPGGAKNNPFSFILRLLMGLLNKGGEAIVYIGFIVVITVLYDLPAPAGSTECATCTWTYLTPVAPAVECVINLTVQYFGVYFFYKLCEVYNAIMLSGRPSFMSYTLKGALPSVKLCPMLAILFVGARMRALQMNLASPPIWAQMSFYAATYACLVQTLTSIMIPIATGEANAGRDEDGNVVTTYGKPSAMANILAFLRTLSILVLIFGVVVSGYSIFAMEASFGETPPVSTTLLCVLNMTAQFLVVEISRIVADTYSKLMLGGHKTDVNRVLDGAVPTLSFIPMLCVLFVATRMRALQLNAEGAPQIWVQHAMEMCTYAMLVQTIAVLVLPFTSGELEVHIDVPYLTKILNGVKYACLGMVFVGITMTIYGVETL